MCLSIGQGGKVGVGSERYRYNGKELNEELELYDYGARWYDPSIARWTSVDPLADQFAAHSPYHYAYNNPLRFIDPDGRSADDIILNGNTPEERQEAFNVLKQLTNDKLTYDRETGEVLVVSSAEGDNVSAGTSLIRSLIKDDNTTNVKTANASGTVAIDETGDRVSKEDQENFTEYDSQVYFKNSPSATTNQDGTIGGAPAFISLGHELKHAQDNAEGTNHNIGIPAFDFDGAKVRPNFGLREMNTRVFENRLRSENGVKPRALPIPLFMPIIR
jgi:RHS repeat-associated protein